MNKRILLLFPNTSNDGVMPLAVAILSSIAKDLGYTIEYFDTTFYRKEKISTEAREKSGEFKGVNRDDFIELKPYESMHLEFSEVLNDYQPDILAVTANSLEYELFNELMEAVEFKGPKPFVMVGGVHATLDSEEVINNPFVDAICTGEGEIPWEEFLIKFEEKSDFHTIKNLWVKHEGEIHRNPEGYLLGEDKLWDRPLDLTLFDERNFLYVFDGVTYKKGNIELSRGCPYECTYCVNTIFKNNAKGLGKFFRIRSIENIGPAIEQLINMGCEMLYFQDESFLSINEPTLRDFCSWYAKEVKLPLLVMARPETVTESKVKLLADMNVPIQVSLGVESGSQRILTEICNRKTTVEELIAAGNMLKKYNIRMTGFTMIGFPTETREEAFMTIDLMRTLDMDNSVMSIFYPFKGLPLRDFCLERGYITGDEPARSFTSGSILKNQPMTSQEVFNIRRCYSLYTKLPLEYMPDVEKCEKDYENNKELFAKLVDLVLGKYYRSWDLGKNLGKDPVAAEMERSETELERAAIC